MIDEHDHLRLRSAEHIDPIWRLWEELPAQWRGPVLGPGIGNWASITENDWPQLDLSGLPDPFAAELAWMAHWQASDGTRVSVLAMAQLANMIRRAVTEGRGYARRSGRWITTPPQRCRAGSISAGARDCPLPEAGGGCTHCSASPATP
ncbi:hypothetical protein [Mycolicibacterium agri]|uniref:Uncharacterized protein n=1 Tax=Mycolicibacterium agri TaxID=36811 RepID=A0A7I9WD02_MYCAG|nr:hypothetical protein [Mycolicibacterium agri]GFG55320.1 hypothetical protein MAGR_67610 [Mycolicibacterium agri]